MSRILSFMGACGLVLAVSAFIPALPIYSGTMGSGCTGSGCPESVDDGNCEDNHSSAECSCHCNDGPYNSSTGKFTCDCKDT